MAYDAKNEKGFKLNAADKKHIEYLVGKHHVGTSDEKIAEEFAQRCAQNKIGPRATKLVIAHALKAHKANFDLYARVMTGRL